jgi:hypothetical protein
MGKLKSRSCTRCKKTIKSDLRLCGPCRATDRICAECGDAFKGNYRLCPPCRKTDRTCPDCGEEFNGATSQCWPCRRKSVPPEIRHAKRASEVNARRARKYGAEVVGPVPPEVYAAIRASGPCVYCGEAATAVDHIRPFARGGWEHEDNLVPTCDFCNQSKGPRLLTEWSRTERVAYGVAHSSKVAAEYERLTTLPPPVIPSIHDSR